jgi:arylsulfatase A-like enzyme
VGYLDAQIGRIRAELARLGVADRTIIMFTADNGTANGDKGSYDRDRGLRVPFVVAGGPVPALGESRALIDFTDIWATAAELTGYAGPARGDGHSFAPLLLGRPFVPRETIRMAMNNARWIRDADWLLDGTGRFWSVRAANTWRTYRDVSESDDPEVIAARRRFEAYVRDFPLPDEHDPLTAEAWRRFYKQGGKPVEIFRPPYLNKE